MKILNTMLGRQAIAAALVLSLAIPMSVGAFAEEPAAAAAADDAELHIRPSLPVSARPGTRKDTAELCRVFLHILFPMRRLSPPCSSGSQRQ